VVRHPQPQLLQPLQLQHLAEQQQSAQVLQQVLLLVDFLHPFDQNSLPEF
jgi:hypothetical protein